MQLVNVGNFRSKKHNNQGLLLIFKGKRCNYNTNKIRSLKHVSENKDVLAKKHFVKFNKDCH